MTRDVLIVEDIHKVYDDGTYAVRGVSFKVREGEIYGLIGPNGAGKTTTLRIITGLIKPTRGRVLIDDYDIHRELYKARRLISYLPEDADVYERLTGLEHIRFYAKLYGVENIDETIEYAVKLCGLSIEKLNEKAGNYSKGMKRRLLLALTLMRKPRLTLLDEPTSGLDVQAAVRVRDMIKKYVRESGSSIVISSHNMLEVMYLCDRVGIIYNGSIIVEDTPANILARFNASNLEEAFIKIIEESG